MLKKIKEFRLFLKELTSCRVNNINGKKFRITSQLAHFAHIFAFCLYSWQLNNYYSNFFVVLLAVVVVVVSCLVHPDYSR